MSYSRVVQPRGSAVQRQRGGLRRPQASSYDPQPVNRAEAGHVEHPTRDDDEGEELGERSDFQGRATGRRSRDEERRVRRYTQMQSYGHVSLSSTGIRWVNSRIKAKAPCRLLCYCNYLFDL